MSSSGDAIKTFRLVWDELIKMRPGEGDFAPHGYPNLNYQSLVEIFERWSAAFELMDKKAVWVTSPEAALADKPIADSIANLIALTSSAQSNGIAWLLSNQFLQKVMAVQTDVASLIGRWAAVVRQVSRDISDRGSQQLDRVLAAGVAADRILAVKTEVDEQASVIKQHLDAAHLAQESVSTTQAEVTKLAADATKAATLATGGQQSVEAALTHVNALKDAAEKRETALSERVTSLDSRISETQKAAEEALSTVEAALKSVRRQGLAGAFQFRSDKLRKERRLWTITFIGAVVILGVLSALFAAELQDIKYETLVVTLVRKLAIAGPCIWLGWYSAKQIGRVSRVQEDYEYKAATALAFQSYKAEVAAGDSAELTAQLLATAIATFGENPVRLYDDAKADNVTPTSEVVAKVREKGTNELVDAIVALAKRVR